jgi:hypothetical protein
MIVNAVTLTTKKSEGERGQESGRESRWWEEQERGREEEDVRTRVHMFTPRAELVQRVGAELRSLRGRKRFTVVLLQISRLHRKSMMLESTRREELNLRCGKELGLVLRFR